MDVVTTIRSLEPFFDNENYPRGFSKHGDFSIKEARALQHYGRTLHQLSSGSLQPSNKEEQHFVDVANGLQPADSFLERLWLKYQKRISTRSVFYSLCASPVTTALDTVVDDDSLEEDDLVA